MPKNTLRNDRDIERVSVCRARKSITIMTAGCKASDGKYIQKYTEQINYGAIILLEIEVDSTAAAANSSRSQAERDDRQQGIIRGAEDGLGMKPNETFPPLST
jgi:hypothetical protein